MNFAIQSPPSESLSTSSSTSWSFVLVLLCAVKVGQDLLRGFDAGAQVGVLAVVVVLRCFAGVLGLKWFQAVDWQPRILRLLSTLNPSCGTCTRAVNKLCR